MKCPYLQLVSFNVIKKLKKCKAVDWILYCLMKDIMFVVGISFQENRCSWEWVHMSGLKYKPTVMVVSCMNKNISEEEKCGPVFAKLLGCSSAAAAPCACRMLNTSGGCACIPSPCECKELPGAVVRHCWRHLPVFPCSCSRKSWGERLKCCETSDTVNVCLEE